VADIIGVIVCGINTPIASARFTNVGVAFDTTMGSGSLLLSLSLSAV